MYNYRFTFSSTELNHENYQNMFSASFILHEMMPSSKMLHRYFWDSTNLQCGTATLLTLIVWSSAIRHGASRTPNSSQHYPWGTGVKVTQGNWPDGWKLPYRAFLTTPTFWTKQEQSYFLLLEVSSKCENLDREGRILDNWKYAREMLPSGPGSPAPIQQIKINTNMHKQDRINKYLQKSNTTKEAWKQHENENREL